MSKITDILSIDHIIPDIEARTRKEAFESMAKILADKLQIDPEEIVTALIDRESTRSTALEKTGVAVPHARLSGIEQFSVLFARSVKGIDFQAEDHKPSHLLFLIVGPENKPGEYLRMLARVARLCHNDEFRRKLMGVETAEAIRDVIAEEDLKG